MLLNLYTTSVVITSITLMIVGLYQRNHSGIFKDENEDENEKLKEKTRYSLIIEYDSSNKKHRILYNIIFIVVILTPILNIIVGVAFSWYTVKMSIRHSNI